jgi:hypothetical protein
LNNIKSKNKKPGFIRAKGKTAQRKQKAAIKSYYAEKKTEKYDETYPHFRYYKKSGHPVLIVSEHSSEEYNYRKVMHSEKDGKRTNERVFPNPDLRDKEAMYIGKRVRHDEKRCFESQPLPWKYPNKK